MSSPAVDVDDWARQIITQARADFGRRLLPAYGSPAWAILDTPQRWASAVVAAEAWRSDHDPHQIATQLRLELELARCVDHKAREDMEYVAAAHSWAAEWGWLAPALGHLPYRLRANRPIPPIALPSPDAA